MTERPNKELFHAFMKVFSERGNMTQTQELFRMMTQDFTIPCDATTFAYLLNTCPHAKPPRYQSALRILHVLFIFILSLFVCVCMRVCVCFFFEFCTDVITHREKETKKKWKKKVHGTRIWDKT